ncbi:MAG: SUMF1/EgtB/PvdO family nonheme iron enzyme [Pirellulales bacterium]
MRRSISSTWCLLVVLGASLSWAQDASNGTAAAGRSLVVEGAASGGASLFAPLSDVASSGNGGLFVGVNQFTADPDMQPLRFAVNDAVEQCHLFVAELKLLPARQCYLAISGEPSGERVTRHLAELKQLGVQVVGAEKSTILRSFVRTRQGVQPKSGLLVVSFSSHGFTDKRVGYVMPSDGLRTFLEDTAIRLSSVEEQMNASQAGHRLLLVDACQERLSDGARSSRIASGRAMTADFLELLKKPTGQSKLVSCDVGEFSYEHSELGGSGHGVFTYALLEALRGGASADDQNVVRLSSVAGYVERSVRRWTEDQNRRRRPGDPEKKQSPSYQGPEAARELPLAKKAGDLAALVASVRRQPTTGAFTSELQSQLAEILLRLDPRQDADQELLAATRDFVNGKARVALFVPYVRGELDRRANHGRPQPGAITVNNVGMKLAYIPAGEFWMGSPEEEAERFDNETRHQIRITQGYYLGQYEVTQEEYLRVMGKNPSDFSPDGEGKDDVAGLDTSRFPVESVSWEEAVEFCRRLSALPAERAKGLRYRLPTEAEWEYACRAGTTTPFHFGSVLNGDRANCDGNTPYGTSTKGKYLARTTRVGSYVPNAWGLYDMHGNVNEWCSDWYDSYESSLKADPIGPSEGSHRVFRGGSWGSRPSYCRSALRDRVDPSSRNYGLGFRVAAVQSSE